MDISACIREYFSNLCLTDNASIADKTNDSNGIHILAL